MNGCTFQLIDQNGKTNSFTIPCGGNVILLSATNYFRTVTVTNPPTCSHPKVTRKELDSRKWTDGRGINEIMKYDTGKVITGP